MTINHDENIEVFISLGFKRDHNNPTVGDLRALLALIDKFKLPDDHPLLELVTSVDVYIKGTDIDTIACGEHVPFSEQISDILIKTHECVIKDSEPAPTEAGK